MIDHLGQLRDELVLDEGDKRRLYRCTAGHLTGGIGHNLDAKPLSTATVDLWFLEDVGEAETALDAIEPRWRTLDGDRQRVLINMAFNLGQTRLAGFKRFWQAIGDFLDGKGAIYLSVAADEILDSDAARELPARYKRLADRMRGGLASST